MVRWYAKTSGAETRVKHNSYLGNLDTPVTLVRSPCAHSLKHHLSELRRLSSHVNSKIPLVRMKRSDPLRDLERDRDSPF